MANSPATAAAPEPRNQPVHEVRLGSIKAAIWQNETEAGVRYNVTFERLYNQDGKWHSTGSFGRDDLLLLRKVADLAHSWIIEPDDVEAAAPARVARNTSSDMTGKSLPRRPSSAKSGE